MIKHQSREKKKLVKTSYYGLMMIGSFQQQLRFTLSQNPIYRIVNNCK